jgi:hypothetical protein
MNFKTQDLLVQVTIVHMDLLQTNFPRIPFSDFARIPPTTACPPPE